MSDIPRCVECFLPFGEIRQRSAKWDALCSRCAPLFCSGCDEPVDECKGCGQECDCETHEAHDAACDEAMRDFLKSPGPPPADWDAEQVARVQEAIGRERERLKMK